MSLFVKKICSVVILILCVVRLYCMDINKKSTLIDSLKEHDKENTDLVRLLRTTMPEQKSRAKQPSSGPMQKIIIIGGDTSPKKVTKK